MFINLIFSQFSLCLTSNKMFLLLFSSFFFSPTTFSHLCFVIFSVCFLFLSFPFFINFHPTSCWLWLIRYEFVKVGSHLDWIHRSRITTMLIVFHFVCYFILRILKFMAVFKHDFQSLFIVLSYVCTNSNEFWIISTSIKVS